MAGAVVQLILAVEFADGATEDQAVSTCREGESPRQGGVDVVAPSDAEFVV
jgi:hypothetical protein